MVSLISQVRYGMAGEIKLKEGLDTNPWSAKDAILKCFEMTPSTTFTEWYGNDVVIVTAQPTSEAGIPPGKYRKSLPCFQGMVGLIFGQFFGLTDTERDNSSLTMKMLRRYQKHGLSGFSELNGGWVGVLWDQSTQQAHFVRDHVGIKTLYVAHHDGSLLFSTDLRVLRMSGLESELDENALMEFLHYLYVPTPRTIEKACRAILPGHALTLGPHERNLCFAEHRFQTGPALSGDTAVQERIEAELPVFEKKLTAAVKECIPSNGRVALMLSGGKDSSTLAIILSKLCPRRVLCVNVGAADEHVNEADDAALVSKSLGLEYMSYIPTDAHIADGMYKFAALQDQPIGDPSALPYFLALMQLPDDCQVVMDGTGNDYYFGLPDASKGIQRYQRRKQLQRYLPGAIWATFVRLIAFKRFKELRRAWLNPIEETFVSWEGWSEEELVALSLKEVSFENTRLWEMMHKGTSDDWMCLLANVVCGVWEPHAAYRKGVYFANGLGLSLRYPFADNRIAEYVNILPRELKYQGNINKVLIRAYMAKHLPQKILEKPKGPFVFNLNRVLNNPLLKLVEQLERAKLLRCLPQWSEGPINDLKKLHEDQPTAEAPQQKLYALCLLSIILEMRSGRDMSMLLHSRNI